MQYGNCSRVGGISESLRELHDFHGNIFGFPATENSYDSQENVPNE